MSEELFACCYVEEGISPVFVEVLRKNGFIVKTAEELDARGKSDSEHLDIAIGLKSTLITVDKRTFLVDSKAEDRKHFGIILITRQFGDANANSAAEQVIKKFLNVYTKDEWAQGMIVKL